MGGEYSRRSSSQSCEDSMVAQVMNNQQPLKFHAIHGENIHLSENWSVASRGDGFCKGIVFSNRPVLINEYIYIKFLDVSSSWSGGLRIGFTANDPVSYKNKLPKYACPCMTDTPGNWARAIAERYVQKNAVLFYYVNQNGEVHYGLNNEERGIFFQGVNTSGKLWALMDIYGNTIKIELLADPYYLSHARQRPTEELCNSAMRILRNAAQEMASIYPDTFMSPQLFHERHTRYATLDQTRSVASFDSYDFNQAYVFSDSYIELNKFYVIKISQCERNSEELIFGLTSSDPSSLLMDDLPLCPDDLFDRLDYWVVHRIKENCEPSDSFAFIVNNEGAVKYTKNCSRLMTAMYVDHTLNLWFFFCINNSVGEIQFQGSWSTSDNEVLTHLQSLQYQYSSHSSDATQLCSAPSQSQSEDSNECVICYEADKDTALYRCGHVCTCFRCATQLFESSKPQCPICRDPIVDVIKLYK